MHAKPFTLSVIVATVIGGVGLLSTTVDRQEPTFRPVAAPVRTLVGAAAKEPATASPIDLDPRRMAAPASDTDPDGALAATDPATRRVAASTRY